jgi:hypothetical protein
MPELTIEDLYLAWRQAKTALYYERRGVGLLGLAQFEAELPARLRALLPSLNGDAWFDNLSLGDVWIVPKRLDGDARTDGIVWVGGRPEVEKPMLDVQLRLAPSAEFAIAELLYLRRFGPVLDGLLSPASIGYRLDLRDRELDPTRRWTFEFWPRRYQQFRSAPLHQARAAMAGSESSVVLVSADLASFYDSIDPSFLVSASFVARLRERGLDDPDDYAAATNSLLRAFHRFREQAEGKLGQPVRTGIPIGCLTSRVVANVALDTLDAAIERHPGVLSYRRYVDDLVIVARPPEEVTSDAVLASLLPLASSSDDGFRLDVNALERPGCEFALQRRKVKIHHLTGSPGQDFVEAVLSDFDRVVSRSQAFLDTASLLKDGAEHLIRATDGHGSPLRVLRDADRTRLERFALSTSLQTLERATVMLDPEEAQRVVRSTLERVGRVLGAEDDWIESLDAALRLLRLAVGTRDWDSAKELNDRFEVLFGSTEALKLSLGGLRYRGAVLDPDSRRAWISLRDFLHTRRLESVSAALPPEFSPGDLALWAPGGLTVRTGKAGAVSLRRRAQELALADLRTHDREEDHRLQVAAQPADWMEADLPGLAERFTTIRAFLEACARLQDEPWVMAPARLYLSTRPPSYFDIARRLLYRVEAEEGFPPDIFDRLLGVVNAIRGTRYSDPVGKVQDPHTVQLPWIPPDDDADSAGDDDPTLVLGNLVVQNRHFERAAQRTPGHPTGRPVHSLERLLGLVRVIEQTRGVANRGRVERRSVSPTLLVLPELSIPRRWFRAVSTHIVRHGGFGAVMGLEYLHDPNHPHVLNQAYAVLPGPFGAVATWPWTKRWPADGEGRHLSSLNPSLSFRPVTSNPPRVVVHTSWGRFSALICSELIEAHRVADLLGRAELILCPAWNTDTASYDHLIQSVGLQLHAIIAVANNGHYSDCRAWAPKFERWKRDLCRLIERDVDDIVHVVAPMKRLIAFHRAAVLPAVPRPDCPEGCEPKKPEWKPLPPGWPPGGGGA